MANNNSAIYEGLLLFINRFMQLSEDEFSQLTGMLVFQEFPKKYILINEGEIAQHLYFINKGLIHQYFYSGKEIVTTDVVGEHTITGSVSSFLSGKASHYYLQTMEPTAVFIISKQRLDELYKKDIKWQRFGRILITHFLLQQEQHILDNIRYTIRERLVHFAEAYPDLLKRVPQRRLASYLDMKPETFSRIKPLIGAKKKAPAIIKKKVK